MSRGCLTYQYRQLVEFLGQQFTQIDGRFQQIDARFVEIDARFAQVDARFVEVHREIQLSENVDRRFVEFDARMQAQFDEVKGLIRVGYVDLDRRVRRLEGG